VKKIVIKQEGGFSLIELLLTMTIFVIAIATSSNIFTGLFNQYKQQSKIAETNVEGLIGLELLRQDLDHAGYGLPWNVTGVADTDSDGNLWDELSGYNEAADTAYNDTASAPRALVSDDGVGVNNSDYLVIKSVNVARNRASQRSTHVNSDNEVKEWDPSSEMLSNGDRVIVLSPGGVTNQRSLIAKSDGSFFTTYNAGTDPDSLSDSAFAPTDVTENRIVYGVDPDTTLGMPFNRADYFLADSNVPDRCAPGTAVLRKSTVNHAGGGLLSLPLLDCAADIQVSYFLDIDEDGTIGTRSNADGSTITNVDGGEGATVATVQATLDDASLLRERLKEVRVYVLAQEGQKDATFTYSSSTILVGDRSFDLGGYITDWENYRWKLYRLIITPVNLR
jgi:prepilin-type N-terminal cleavage/methylation domain-containing protein